MTNSSVTMNAIKSYRRIALAFSLLAFACQLPWLVVTDFYGAGLPAVFIAKLALVLFLGNLLWALLLHLAFGPVKKYLC